MEEKINYGKTILRAQWNHRQERWRIVEKTYNGAGGWKLFASSEGYTDKQEATEAIEKIIKNYPENYDKG